MDRINAMRKYVTQEPSGKLRLHVKRARFFGYDCDQTQQMAEELSAYYHRRICNLLDTLARQDREINRLKSRRPGR